MSEIAAPVGAPDHVAITQVRLLNYGGFAELIDEPEQHLHPGMQQRLLPALQRAFPLVQFIVATHTAPRFGAPRRTVPSSFSSETPKE